LELICIHLGVQFMYHSNDPTHARTLGGGVRYVYIGSAADEVF